MKKKILDSLYNHLESDGSANELTTLTLPMTLICEKMRLIERQIYEKKDLTQAEIDVIATLYLHGGGLTASEVSERMLFTSGGLSKVIKKLEFKKLIYKKESEEDKRSFLLYLEDKAVVLFKELLPEFDKCDKHFFGMLNETEIEVMEKALKKILYTLSEKKN